MHVDGHRGSAAALALIISLQALQAQQGRARGEGGRHAGLNGKAQVGSACAVLPERMLAGQARTGSQPPLASGLPPTPTCRPQARDQSAAHCLAAYMRAPPCTRRSINCSQQGSMRCAGGGRWRRLCTMNQSCQSAAARWQAQLASVHPLAFPPQPQPTGCTTHSPQVLALPGVAFLPLFAAEVEPAAQAACHLGVVEV